MPQVAFQEFRDENKEQSYPFIDNASLTDTSGMITIPKDVFIDASFYIPNATAPIFLKKLIVDGEDITLIVEDNSSNYQAYGSVHLRADCIAFEDTGHNKVGIMVSETGRLSFFANIPDGEYTFLQKATAFVPRCVIHIVDAGVSTIGINEDIRLCGDVWLCGDRGVIIRKIGETGIRFDLVGDPLYKQTMCEDAFEVPNPLRTLNDLTADEYGNFVITVDSPDNALRIKTDTTGITISVAGF